MAYCGATSTWLGQQGALLAERFVRQMEAISFSAFASQWSERYIFK